MIYGKSPPRIDFGNAGAIELTEHPGFLVKQRQGFLVGATVVKLRQIEEFEDFALTVVVEFVGHAKPPLTEGGDGAILAEEEQFKATTATELLAIAILGFGTTGVDAVAHGIASCLLFALGRHLPYSDLFVKTGTDKMSIIWRDRQRPDIPTAANGAF